MQIVWLPFRCVAGEEGNSSYLSAIHRFLRGPGIQGLLAHVVNAAQRWRGIVRWVFLPCLPHRLVGANAACKATNRCFEWHKHHVTQQV